MTLLRASTLQDAGSVSGPSSYSQGTGTPADEFTVRSDLDRVDEASVSADAGSVNSHVVSITSNNRIHIGVYSADTGNEIQTDDDLTADTYTYEAYKL